MFVWNGIKIYIEGGSNEFILQIRKFFYASLAKFSKKDCDIVFSLYSQDNKCFPVPKENARLVKSITIVLDKEYKLDIYSYGQKLWYIYHDIAGVWIDFKNNKAIISLSNNLFPFFYYNILFFFLYPLSAILENFGYFRLHASSAILKNKAVLFTGKSFSGKSTSAFAIASGKGTIISDDMTFVKKTGGSYFVYTITKLVKLREDVLLDFFPEFLKYDYIKNENEERYFNADDINKNKTNNKTVLKAIIILEKTGKEFSSYSKVSLSEVVPHIFPTSVRTSIEKYTHREFMFITDLLNDIPCYKVYFGTDMADFSRNINDLLSDLKNEK